MASLSLPTKNQFAFTYVTTPIGDDLISIGQNFFAKKKGETLWTHSTLNDYFSGQSLKSDEEKHDATTFPIDSLDQHYFTNKGVEVIVANSLIYYRAYPTENVWHVIDHPSTSLSPMSSRKKRLLIRPIENIALEGNTMFVDSGSSNFEFIVQDAPLTPQSLRCKSCHETFTVLELPHTTIICPHCSCADFTRLT